MNKSQLDKFVTEKDVDSVLHKLRRYGLSIVPNYLDENLIKTLKTEFDKAIITDHSSISEKYDHPTNENGKVTRISAYHKNAKKEFPSIINLFFDPFMENISKLFFSPHKFDFNEVIICSHELSSKKKILPWHFDRIQSLKFWFYLNNVSDKNGSLKYSPGSHWEGKYRAGYHLLQGKTVGDIPNDIDDDLIQNPISINLNAGDLLIFDSDGFHAGGVVKSGNERKVLRAHTYPSQFRKYKDKIFSKGWWLTSRLNLSKIFSSKGMRVIGSKMKDKTINRRENFPKS